VPRELGKETTVEFKTKPMNNANTGTHAFITRTGTSPCPVLYRGTRSGSQDQAAVEEHDDLAFSRLTAGAGHGRGYDHAGALLRHTNVTVTRIVPPAAK